MSDSIQTTQETKPYSTKRRGVIWLVASIVLFGAAFFLFTLIAISTAMRAALAIGRDVAENVVVLAGGSGFDAQVPYQLSRLALGGHLLVGLAIVLGYFGIWYGVVMIVSAYKKYSVSKARLLTVLLAIGFAALVLLINAYFEVSAQCEFVRNTGGECPALPMPIFIEMFESIQTWIRVLVYEA